MLGTITVMKPIIQPGVQMRDQYGCPVLVDRNSKTTQLKRLEFQATGEQGYDEEWIQTLLFENPMVLPIDQIDHAFDELIPVCRELPTDVGPLDVLYVTPKGRLAILEAKLWRNPEARRKVISQILDYATDMSQWSYEDLQRTVSTATGRTGNALFQLVHERHPEIQEKDFVDQVSRCLRTGQFLLLIVGDGIREGANAIAAFLARGGAMQFTFGLVELAVFQVPDGPRLVQPRVLTKTTEIQRTVVVLTDDRMQIQESKESDGPQEDDPELSERQKTLKDFWTSFLAQLQLDDQSQPMAKPTKTTNIYFAMPPKNQGWVSAWVGTSGRHRDKAGVYLTFLRKPEFDVAYSALESMRSEIDKELGFPVGWETEDGKHSVWIEREFPSLLTNEQRVEVFKFLGETVNKFVNAFRHRLTRLETK